MRRSLICTAVLPETVDAKTYCFQAEDGLPILWTPGQFLDLAFMIAGEEIGRSYTASCPPRGDGRVEITVKKVAGGQVSTWLFEHMAPGIRVSLGGAYGEFTLPGGDDPVLLLTAGSGVTPAAAMLRDLCHRAPQRDVVLLHFARSAADMLFLHEMPFWAHRLGNARIIPVLTGPAAGWVGPVGRPTAALLAGLVPDIARRRVFCCGPEGFMQAARALGPALGLPVANWTEESFGEIPALAPAPGAARFEVRFRPSGKVAACTEGGTLVEAARAAGVHMRTSCRQGACGTCRVRLVAGEVDMTAKGGITPREIAQGWVLACCSRPTTDVTVAL